jgi:hypothetical protein
LDKGPVVRALISASLYMAAVAAPPPIPGRAADPPAAEKPVLNRGDVFEYVDRFETVRCKRWEVAGRDGKGAVISRCGGNTAYFSEATGALLGIVARDGTDLVRFEPAAPAIAFPLRVGSTWGGTYRVSTHQASVSPSLEETCKVVAFETVHIAAGALPAFRYRCRTRWTVWALHGDVTETGWYAPSAKVVVKVVNDRDPSWNVELAGYALK